MAADTGNVADHTILTTLLSKREDGVMPSRGSLMYDLVRLVRPMTLSSARAVEAGLRPFGLTVGRRAVLEILVEGGAMPVPAIAQALDVSRQAAQRLVNELLAGDYVAVSPNPRHRRSQFVDVTSAGRDAFRHVHAEELRLLQELAPEVATPDLEQALRVLSAVARDIRRNALDLNDDGGVSDDA
jgi:DNA-binding MarR family transcriptional regulator